MPPSEVSPGAWLCGGQTPSLGELEEIVGGADDRPFATHLFQAAHQELAETAGLFHLPEHRFGQLLA